MKFPIIVQTLWERNGNHWHLTQMGTGKEIGFIIREFWKGIRSRKDAAFVLCIQRSREHIEETLAGTMWEVFVDAGKENPGKTVSATVKWSGPELVRVRFEVSQI